MKHSAHGFSLIELLITLGIAAFLLALGASSFTNWIGNMKIRTTAESIQNGLQLARGEAVRRNASGGIGFYLTSDLSATCSLITPAAATVSSWAVSYDDPAGACATALLTDAVAADAAAQPRIIQTRPAAEGSNNVLVTATQSSLVFNSLGRATALTANPAVFSVTSGDAACVDAGGTRRCLNVQVTLGGQVRMCDPQLTITNSTDPQAC